MLSQRPLLGTHVINPLSPHMNGAQAMRLNEIWIASSLEGAIQLSYTFYATICAVIQK
jgi:hypothetical protein